MHIVRLLSIRKVFRPQGSLELPSWIFRRLSPILQIFMTARSLPDRDECLHKLPQEYVKLKPILQIFTVACINTLAIMNILLIGKRGCLSF